MTFESLLNLLWIIFEWQFESLLSIFESCLNHTIWQVFESKAWTTVKYFHFHLLIPTYSIHDVWKSINVAFDHSTIWILAPNMILYNVKCLFQTSPTIFTIHKRIPTVPPVQFNQWSFLYERLVYLTFIQDRPSGRHSHKGVEKWFDLRNCNFHGPHTRLQWRKYSWPA